jgi:hypothetical protein
VPKEEHRLFIISALKRAVEVGMLTLQEADAMCSKIITYPEFLRLPPQAIVNAKSLQHAVLDAPFSNKEIH